MHVDSESQFETGTNDFVSEVFQSFRFEIESLLTVIECSSPPNSSLAEEIRQRDGTPLRVFGEAQFSSLHPDMQYLDMHTEASRTAE